MVSDQCAILDWSSSGTPISAHTMASGKGRLRWAMRSSGPPRPSIRSRRRSTTRWACSWSRRIDRAVKALATTRRIRVWSGGSANPTAPSIGMKCGASLVTWRPITA